MNSDSRIGWLDGWRCIAVSFVIVAHADGFYGWHIFSSLGKLGVYIFFAISGYIVTKTLLKESERSGSIDVGYFYKRRALRILPPLFFYLAFCLVLFWKSSSVHIAALRSATFTCNLSIPLGSCEWIFGHTWSLAFEEQFYLLLPFLFAPPRQWGGWVLLLLALLLALTPFIWPIHFVGRIGFVQIYMLLMLGAVYARFQSTLELILLRIPAFVSLTALVLAGLWMSMPPSDLQMIAGPFVALLTFIGIFSLPVGSEFFNKMLSSRPLRTIGLYSYTLYLWQQLAFVEANWNTGLVPMLLLLAAFAIAAISYHTLEAAFRQLAIKSHPLYGIVDGSHSSKPR